MLHKKMYYLFNNNKHNCTITEQDALYALKIKII